jgi:hypothetical protein
MGQRQGVWMVADRYSFDAVALGNVKEFPKDSANGIHRGSALTLRMIMGGFLVSVASIKSHRLRRRWPFTANNCPVLCFRHFDIRVICGTHPTNMS